jgi:hypothetical protein
MINGIYIVMESLRLWTVPSCKMLSSQNHNVSKTEYVSVFKEREGDTYSFGFLHRANLNHPLPSPEDGTRSSFRNVVFSSYL